VKETNQWAYYRIGDGKQINDLPIMLSRKQGDGKQS
jgi:hypothetical protein